MAGTTRFDIDRAKITDFCRRNRICKLWLCGSVLKRDFDTGSPVEVVVDFDPEAELSFWDVVEIQEQLADLLGREVELVETEGLSNPIRRREILRTRQLVYAASRL